MLVSKTLSSQAPSHGPCQGQPLARCDSSSPDKYQQSRFGELKIDHTLANSGGIFPEIELDQVVLGLRDSHRTPLYLRLIGLRPVPIQRTRTLGWLVEAGVLMHLH
jgi:hypothetical protein